MQPHTASRHHNSTIQNQLKSKTVNRPAIEAVLTDGKKRHISACVFMLEIDAAGGQSHTGTEKEERRFALHSKRCEIPVQMTMYVEIVLRECGWRLVEGGVLDGHRERGLWTGTFTKSKRRINGSST